MEKHIINDSTYLLYFTAGDLGTIVPENITPTQAQSLALDAIGNGKQGGNLSIELFTAHDSLMIFADVLSQKPYFFAFNGIEEVISACNGCPQISPSTLTYIDGEYIMTIYPRKNERPPLSMAEFGQELDAADGYGEHLTECGHEIISGDAVERIKNVFAR